MIKILLVGEDFRLLATRAAVLARTGASTVCCSPAEMFRDLRRETFDLVVMCHSLPESSAMMVAGTARQWWPGAKVLLIHSNFGRPVEGQIECDAVIESDPGEMVREAAALLRTVQAKSDGQQQVVAVPAIRPGHA